MKRFIKLNEALDILSVKDIIEPIINDENADIDKIGDQVFSILVPANGKASTVGGEIFRAVNRIYYRWYNDGDIAGVGYGKETVNPAVRYLSDIVNQYVKSSKQLEKVVNYFMNCVEDGNETDENRYESHLKALYLYSLIAIYEDELYTKPNNVDMLSYATDNDIETYDDEWEDDYEEDDYEEDEVYESKVNKHKNNKYEIYKENF